MSLNEKYERNDFNRYFNLYFTTVFMQRLNRALCRRNGFTFVDNGAVTENDLWFDGIRLQESSNCIIPNNLINSFNHF